MSVEVFVCVLFTAFSVPTANTSAREWTSLCILMVSMLEGIESPGCPLLAFSVCAGCSAVCCYVSYIMCRSLLHHASYFLLDLPSLCYRCVFSKMKHGARSVHSYKVLLGASP